MPSETPTRRGILVWLVLLPVCSPVTVAPAATVASPPAVAPLPAGAAPSPPPLAKASAETVYILGGPGRTDGKFEHDLYPGLPDEEGWVPAPEWDPPLWHADTFNAELLDPDTTPNHAMWCGKDYLPCGTGPDNRGYANELDESLEWSGAVDDPARPTVVRVTARLNHDTEPGYDFLTFEVMTATGWTALDWFDGANRTGGEFVPVAFDRQTIIQPEDYQGPEGDEIRLRWRFVSDGGVSDADCWTDTDGAAQLDNIAVTFDQGEGTVPRTYDDFEPGHVANWTARDNKCSFARIWPRLDDVGLCRRNGTPQLAFIDDGSLCDFSDGTPGVTWTYGPGAYVAHCPQSHAAARSEFWSPPLEIPTIAAGFDGAELAFDVYSHGNTILTPTISWAVRTSGDGGQTWSPWRNDGFVYEQGPPAYRRLLFALDSHLDADADRIQLSLGTVVFTAFMGHCDEFTPAPYFDNVSIRLFPRGGPRVALGNVPQDAFPTSGELDLNDLAANGARFASVNGEPVTVRVALREGAALVGAPLMHWRLRTNPLFAAHRTASPPNPLPGTAVPGGDGAFAFALPDTGFLFPGDIIHFAFEVADDLGGSVGTTWLPADTSGLSLFPGDPGHAPGLYSRDFQMRALPTLRNVSGDQPRILLWQNYAGAGADDEWAFALANLGFASGVDYDLYRTPRPGAARLGTGPQIAGYVTLLYDGDRTDATVPQSQDLTALRGWAAAGGKRALFMGEDVARCFSRTGDSGFLTDYLGVAWTGSAFDPGDVRPLIDGQTAPLVVPEPGNPVGIIGSFIPNSCRDYNDFDGLQTGGAGQRLLSYAAPGGGAGGYVHSAGILNVRLAEDARFVTLPFGLRLVESAPDDDQGPLSARARLLRDVLAYFGHAGGPGTPVPGGGEPADVLSARAYPNPFNPRATIAYAMPRGGRLEMRVHDARGRLVRTLIDRAVPAGAGEVAWDGRDDTGRDAAAGVYFCRIRAGEEVLIRKLALVR